MDMANKTDKSNMINILESIPEQIAEAIKLAKDVKVTDPVKRIMVAGMGGSAVSGDILKAYLRDKIDVTVNKDYSLPELAGKETLLFIVSYSGNTEETISAFRTAQRKNMNMVVITTGGKLEELSKISKTPCIIIPKGFQPRAALAYLFFPMLAVLYNSHFIDNPVEDIKNTIKALKNPKFKERAQDLAEKLVEKIPLIYSSEKMGVVAYRWKTQFNENAKIHAFCHVFPELNHNELVGYGNIKAGYHVVIIKDDDDYVKIKKRMDITKRLISEAGINVTEMVIKGDCFLTKLFSAIYLGDLTSYYLALKYGTDPTPVDVIEELKKEL
ncbi:bifunctional phosphoglucose/phosphomannose isomerase [Candidatus Woesearchaeota archaeon CG_4_10_14_0_2_um_filter_33_10]|nr:MAG: bifunctional phosphoglucose/phosphomannose isomerase [Candidatus Woesearchaeota archaeon CG10_big_fil_rev_8_21_14_0_10_33_12]PIZ53526.1 MAG: bifunctional phosphoglucose/phosphomannose isomerase [Candidatus Woesearchaeota archaeon CG_4_10_14_0_2_um_filter_33_10]